MYKNSLLYAGLPLLSLLILGASTYAHRQERCRTIEVAIQHTMENRFLEEGDIRTLINAESIRDEKPLGAIDLRGIEQQLHETGYVNEVEAAIGYNEVLRIQLQLRKPIARFYQTSAHSFYVDSSFRKIPTSRNFSARTMLVRGQVTRMIQDTSAAMGRRRVPDSTLMPLVRAIEADPIARALVSELYVQNDQHIYLYPELGNTVFAWGDTSNTAAKLQKLKAYHRKIAPRAGWARYDTVDLAYEGQIIGR